MSVVEHVWYVFSSRLRFFGESTFLMVLGFLNSGSVHKMQRRFMPVITRAFWRLPNCDGQFHQRPKKYSTYLPKLERKSDHQTRRCSVESKYLMASILPLIYVIIHRHQFLTFRI